MWQQPQQPCYNASNNACQLLMPKLMIGSWVAYSSVCMLLLLLLLQIVPGQGPTCESQFIMSFYNPWKYQVGALIRLKQ
jgi:hypothetical protein